MELSRIDLLWSITRERTKLCRIGPKLMENNENVDTHFVESEENTNFYTQKCQNLGQIWTICLTLAIPGHFCLFFAILVFTFSPIFNINIFAVLKFPIPKVCELSQTFSLQISIWILFILLNCDLWSRKIQIY